MRRRLRLMALAISAISVLAFFVPLASYVRHDRRDAAIAAASREADHVATLAAGSLDATQLLTAYAASPNRTLPYSVVVWYPDGRGLPLNQSAAALGEMPAAVRQLADGTAPGASSILAVAGGVQIATSAVGAQPGSPTPVVTVTVSTAELEGSSRRVLLVMVAIAAAIIVASIVVADRVAGMKPPRSPGLGTSTPRTTLA